LLTDIFSVRYESIPLFKSFSRRESRIILQLFNILEEIEPQLNYKNEVRESSKTFWNTVHKRVANELGMPWLSDPYYQTNVGLGEYRRQETRLRDKIYVCQNWMIKAPSGSDEIDEFIKERVSLFEVGMREKYSEIEKWRSTMAANPNNAHLYNSTLKSLLDKHDPAADEANMRFKAAHFPLHYHNGFIQILRDDVISAEIEQPFWSIVSDPIWENVDLDMKEAIDQRDSGGKDPAFYAGKALESTIKIVSGLLQVTHGGEKGAHSYIDNIAKSSVKFIERWEADFLKHYFTNVRNPLGHGPGLEPMPILTFEQSSLAIEIAMSWTRLLAERASQRNLMGTKP
jgi:hypothetical protein